MSDSKVGLSGGEIAEDAQVLRRARYEQLFGKTNSLAVRFGENSFPPPKMRGLLQLWFDAAQDRVIVRSIPAW